MNNRLKNIFTVAVLALLVAGIVYVGRDSVSTQVSNTVFSVKEYLSKNNIIATTIREQLFPQTLVSSSNGQKGVLSVGQVIELTNTERQNEGLPLLTENSKLNMAAQKKLDDLFARQYFDHVSPDGNGPSWLADEANYKYVVVGENLALGDFKDNPALVQAWMNSPGHKANILNPRFVDIGVAVGRGQYEGKNVWIAVQEFGKPLSDCPAIDLSLRTAIERDRLEVEVKSNRLAMLRQSLSSLPQSNQEEQDMYNRKATEYNNQVAEYNNASALLKTEIAEYNIQVQTFNSCIKQ